MKVALIGYGKMGKAVDEAITEYNDSARQPIDVILKISQENVRNLDKINLQRADVAIEFTTPSTAIKNIELCIDAGIPVVSGTTGWYDKKEQVEEICLQKNGTLLYSANFSIGVNLFFEINKVAAQLMAEQLNYKVNIDEIHHIEKKDAPSGTAIKIAEQILEKNKHLTKWVNNVTSAENELQIISIRENNISGIHKVIYSGDEDEIIIEHNAKSRKGFALGALKAALWLRGKKGIYTMKHVLGI